MAMDEMNKALAWQMALGQINPTVGDVDGNATKIAQMINAAQGAGARVIVFPELAIVGYPPKDLLLKPHLIKACQVAIERLALQCQQIVAVIGTPVLNEDQIGRPLRNAAVVCTQGRVTQVIGKQRLPSYDVFDETRYFEPTPTGQPINVAVEQTSIKMGVSLCEDWWHDRLVHEAGVAMGTARYSGGSPVQTLADQGVEMLINCSASPFTFHKQRERNGLFTQLTSDYQLPLIYVNQVGGNDELLFDGRSCVVDQTGEMVAQAKAFEEDLLLVDMVGTRPVGAAQKQTCLSNGDEEEAGSLPIEKKVVPAPKDVADVRTVPDKILEGGGIPGESIPGESIPGASISGEADIADLERALVMGLRDYCRKCGFKSIVLGLSGGIDSAVVAAVAVAALGPAAVRGVAMPSRYSSDHSVEDAQQLAEQLGIAFELVPIEAGHQAVEGMVRPLLETANSGAMSGKKTLKKEGALEEDLSEVGRVLAGKISGEISGEITEENSGGISGGISGGGVAYENIQARLRGVILMAISNQTGALLVTTGNKSELAVGYCTLYGDMAGGLAVLSDVPKTIVYQLARYMNQPSSCVAQRVAQANRTQPMARADGHFGGGDSGGGHSGGGDSGGRHSGGGEQGCIPERTITKPPSAELRPDQVDQDSLPDYDVLDAIIDQYVEQHASVDQIARHSGFDEALVASVVQLIDRSEYKRRQAAPGLKVTSRAFGFGWRMPIAQRTVATESQPIS